MPSHVNVAQTLIPHIRHSTILYCKLSVLINVNKSYCCICKPYLCLFFSGLQGQGHCVYKEVCTSGIDNYENYLTYQLAQLEIYHCLYYSLLKMYMYIILYYHDIKYQNI